MNVNLPAGLSRNRGFTLLEILVVVMIIGVIVGTAMLAIGDPAVDRIREENQRLMALVQLAQEEAILQSRDLGIGFWKDGYAFFRPTGAVNEVGEMVWDQLEDDLLRQRSLTQEMRLQLVLEGIEIVMQATAVDKPQIAVFSSGEISPFELIIEYGDRLKRGFSVDPLGSLELLNMDEY